MNLRCALTLLVALAACPAVAEEYNATFDKKTQDVTIHKEGIQLPLVTVRRPNGRPFVHPIYSPDSKSALTEDAPAHHKHQTGLFFGFVNVNGRDFFHNRGADYHGFASLSGPGRQLGDVKYGFWDEEYDLLDKAGGVLLREKHHTRLKHHGGHFFLDLTYQFTANQAVTLGKHDYGGLFLRMPWKQKTGGKAVNSGGDESGKAEGKKAKWVDVGMPIEGRKEKDWGHIAILDHKDNPRHPVAWRVDGQLGVGPALTRAGDYKLKRGDTLTLKYRLVVYTGELDKKLIEKAWKEFTDKKK